MRTLLKWIGILLIGLLIFLVLAGGGMYMVGSSKVGRTYDVQTAALVIPSDSASLAHGRHLAGTLGCYDCHGTDLSGAVFIDEPPFRVSAANLTSGRGGLGSVYSDEDFNRSIRHGIRRDGRSVLIMPSAAYHRLSDGDAAALIAYLRTVPPVDNELPPTQFRPVGRMMAAMLIDPSFEVRTEPTRSTPAPTMAASVEYGRYVTSITCAYCHGDDLRGMQTLPIPDSPPAPDLAASGLWPLEQFKHAMRTGEVPGREPLREEFMPFYMTARMHDAELEAVHMYLSSLLR